MRCPASSLTVWKSPRRMLTWGWVPVGTEPEEINRVVADHLSGLLYCPSNTAVTNLAAEGITRGVHLVGDVMLDVLNWAKERAEAAVPGILNRLELKER